MKICFLDNTQVSYTSNDIYTNKIRGAENLIISLTNEFSKLNHQITVYNNCKKNTKINNVDWINLNNINDNPTYDIAISNNDIGLLGKIKANKKIAISHSIQSIEKFIRKKQLLAYIEHKPKILLLGNYHKKNRSYFLRMFGSEIINYAINDIFLKTNLSDVDPYKGIFTSYRDRNSELLISIWKEHVYPKNNKIKLYLTPNDIDNTKYNIFNRKFGNQQELIDDLLTSRVFLIPGHKAELYCLAAEEARELCVPIVTLGIGSLSERVVHEKTGFIAQNDKQFANYTIELFKNDKLWNDIRSNLIKLRGSKNWEVSAKKFIESIK